MDQSPLRHISNKDAIPPGQAGVGPDDNNLSETLPSAIS
jgi:hypothetical protein